MSLIGLSNTVAGTPNIKMSIKLLPGDSLVTRARNTLVALFLGSPEYTHLLFIDTDIHFSSDTVFRLLEASKTKPIVAAPYPMKGLLFDRLKAFIRSTLLKDPQHEFTDEEIQDSMIHYVFNSFSENEDPAMVS